MSDILSEKKEIEGFLKKLKDYKQLLVSPEAYKLPKEKRSFLDRYFPVKTDEQIKSELRDKLREELVRDSATIGQRITELIGTDEIVIHELGQPRSVNVWHMGLRQELDYRTEEALNACIDFTIQALGKFKKLEEAEINELIERMTTKKPKKDEPESYVININNDNKSNYQKVWNWIDEHRILSILGALAALAAIIGLFYSIFS